MLAKKQASKRLKKTAKKPKSNLTKLDVWMPTPLQRKMVELLINPDDRRSKEDKCKEVGIQKQTLYNWLKIPGFIDFMNSQLDKYTNSELSEVWKALLMQCKRGNIEAIKLYFKMKELDPEIQMKRQLVQKETGNGNQKPSVMIVDDIK
jgi:hypothetical protein